MRILLVEDDLRISEFIKKGLEEKGFMIKHVATGEEARELVFQFDWDLILLDIMLPGLDGIQLIKLLRYKKSRVPVIAISALSQPEDKIAALDSGADDYITKPFHFEELISRINAIHRRSKFANAQETDRILVADIEIDPDTHEVTKKGQRVELSAKEYKLLLYFVQNRGKVLSRTQILNAVWGINYNTNTNVVDVYISYLRAKLDDENEESMIRTIKGAGYILPAEK